MVLCQVVASKNFDLFMNASVLCIIGLFFDTSTAIGGLDTLQNFGLFLVGVINICFIIRPPMSRR